jgi:membrane protein DedA with SNARE-associated domain
MNVWPPSAIWDSILSLVRDNLELAGVIVFALGFAESIAFISLFVPSTILFLGIGGVHAAAGGQFWQLWLAGAAGAAIGDCVSYAVGRIFRDDVHRIWPLTKYPELIPKGRAMFERWGVWSILAGKFIGGLRPFIPVVAGMMAMPWLLFLIGSVVSSLLWAGIFLSPGYGLKLLPL